MVAALVLAINFAPVPEQGRPRAGPRCDRAAALSPGSYLRQRGTRFPLYDLKVASRRIFWVAALGGIIVFGSLMGAMFIGQQFLQNVLCYSTLDAGAAILPAALCMVIVAPRSAKLVEARGARFTLLLGYAFCLLGFVTMLVLWDTGIPYWKVALGYIFMGIGVGLAGTPASHSLTGSVPVKRAGMASGTADLQRDLGGAIMQSILGALLTAGYAVAIAKDIAAAPNKSHISASVENQLTKSFSSAESVAKQYPHYAGADHRSREVLVPLGRELGLRGRDHRRRCSARRSSSSCSPARTRRSACSPNTRGSTARRGRPSRPPSPGAIPRASGCRRSVRRFSSSSAWSVPWASSAW